MSRLRLDVGAPASHVLDSLHPHHESVSLDAGRVTALPPCLKGQQSIYANIQSVDMPPLPVMILDGLADDIESVGSLRDPGEVTPYGLALVDEQQVIRALRGLLRDGLIEARELEQPDLQLVPAADPGSDDATLRQYWFKWTPAGERAWREGHEVLDHYWTAHPPSG